MPVVPVPVPVPLSRGESLRQRTRTAGPDTRLPQYQVHTTHTRDPLSTLKRSPSHAPGPTVKTTDHPRPPKSPKGRPPALQPFILSPIAYLSQHASSLPMLNQSLRVPPGPPVTLNTGRLRRPLLHDTSNNNARCLSVLHPRHTPYYRSGHDAARHMLAAWATINVHSSPFPCPARVHACALPARVRKGLLIFGYSSSPLYS